MTTQWPHKHIPVGDYGQRRHSHIFPGHIHNRIEADKEARRIPLAVSGRPPKQQVDALQVGLCCAFPGSVSLCIVQLSQHLCSSVNYAYVGLI